MQYNEGKNVEINLTNCLDNDAVCNMNVLKIKNLQQPLLVTNGRSPLQKNGINSEDSRASRAETSIVRNIDEKAFHHRDA